MKKMIRPFLTAAVTAVFILGSFSSVFATETTEDNTFTGIQTGIVIPIIIILGILVVITCVIKRVQMKRK